MVVNQYTQQKFYAVMMLGGELLLSSPPMAHVLMLAAAIVVVFVAIRATVKSWTPIREALTSGADEHKGPTRGFAQS